MEKVHPTAQAIPAACYRFTRWHDGRFLTEDGAALYLTGRDVCSCAAWHLGSRPCPHQIALSRKLMSEAAVRIHEARAMVSPEAELPSRCPRCGSPCYHYAAGENHRASVRCRREACSFRQVAKT